MSWKASIQVLGEMKARPVDGLSISRGRKSESTGAVDSECLTSVNPKDLFWKIHVI